MNFGASLAKLAKALGKNVDELDSNDIQKALKNTQESTPPSVLGQGKNLEALQKAKDEAADTVRVMDEPGYPKNITQDDLATAPDVETGFTMVPEGTGVPAIYEAPKPSMTLGGFDKEYGKVAGDFKMKPDLGKQLKEAQDAPIPMSASKASVPGLAQTAESLKGTVDDALEFGGKRFNKKDLAKMLGAGGVGFAGLNVLMGEEEQSVTPPLAPVAKKIEEKKPEEVSPISSSSSQKTKISATQTTSTPSVQEAEKEAGRDQVRDDLNDYMRQVTEAQGIDNERGLLAGLSRAGTQIGAAIGGVKADTSYADILEQKSGQAVKQVLERMKTQQEMDKMKEVKAELSDKEALRDSNSAASITTRSTLRSMGINVPDNLSAMDIKNSGYLGNLLVTKASAQMNKEIAAMKLEDKQDKDIEKLDKDKRDFAKSLRKEATTGAFGKQYATLSTGLRLGRAVEEFAKDPNGYSDYATLMSGLKTLQGDESVVREAEIRLGMSAGSLMDSLQNQVQRAMSGKSLQPAQRENIPKAMRMLTEQSKRQYMDSIQPILEQADSEGVEHKYILPSGLVEVPKQKKQAVAKQTQSLPEGMVKVVRISDGEVRMLPAATASKLSKSKYKIGE